MKGLHLDTIYSRDDGGYYAEVYDETGRTIHVTDVRDLPSCARITAIEWINDHQEIEP